MNLQGKTILVTGASRGIGRAIALELAHQGAQRLILVARTYPRLVEVATEIEAFGVEAVLLALDLAQPREVNIAIAQAWRDYGPIHLLVNCAGVAYQAPFLQSQLPQVQEEIAINLMGMYTITRLIARRMAVQRQGTIVNVSSLMGKIAAPTMATYSATKFGILGFSQALRSELSVHNIRVIALLPSLTDTDMVRNFQWFRWVIPTTPQIVAQALVRGLQRGTPEILVGWQSYLAVWGNRLMPGMMERVSRLMAPLSEKQHILEQFKKAVANSR
ncbi:SDR family NAD(P)-dependent oxidoreductase [Leptolyngbya sp. FACHB-36]|uniref:SDR family NAD(P)-dependent oxidoreductase n=1 Tax=Leptolyngbya sp. FACHB-36 TaxID=2692808 RepID=UPI001680B136|nr:SDR family NAD(P)-dependent oxidoreductase [Leptolyngbya sp. FACHB-36]MBD2022461.1 SDR family NAD(P)-dependent oxidoreductase [Leptolyngbya sp. FACHB-36]